MTVLDHALLRAYADSFFTYGRFENPVWFLGLEEGGCRDLEEASRRLIAWHESGRPLSVDLTDPDEDKSSDEFLRTYGVPARLQTTWANQLRVLQGMAGELPDDERIRHLQTSAHGRLDGPTCLMELFPLPCSDAGAWIYKDLAPGPAANEPDVFASKDAYRRHYLPKRLETITALVKEHAPAALIFTSWSYQREFLSLLSDVEPFESGLEGVQRKAVIGRLHDTVVAVCTHPAHRVSGPRNAFYHGLGRAIAERMPPSVDLKLVA